MKVKKKKGDWVSRLLASVILLCVIVLVYFGVVGIVFLRKIKMPLYFYTTNDYLIALNLLEAEYEPAKSQRTNQEYKELVEDELNLNFYIYCEKSIEKYNGLALVPIRTMILDETLVGYEYCRVFVHEAMHFVKFSDNETYVCYETFKYLYENEDKELHNIGVWYGLEQLRSRCGGEYDCHDQIIRYLKSKTAI